MEDNLIERQPQWKTTPMERWAELALFSYKRATERRPTDRNSRDPKQQVRQFRLEG